MEEVERESLILLALYLERKNNKSEDDWNKLHETKEILKKLSESVNERI